MPTKPIADKRESERQGAALHVRLPGKVVRPYAALSLGSLEADIASLSRPVKLAVDVYPAAISPSRLGYGEKYGE